MRIKKESLRSYRELIFCLFCFVYYTLWAVNKPFNYAPDEHMRYGVSEFLFKNNRFPVGAEMADPSWGFSYACLPTLIRHVMDYVFMKIGSIFSSEEFHILLCARMVSVLCGTLIVWFVIKISKLSFDSPSRWLMVALIAFMPQFAFLSSYVNNDIVALLGVVMILYAWVLGLKENWNFKNCSILAIGIALCAASYYNSYAWILFSMFLFVFTYLSMNKKDYKGMVKLGLFITLVFLLIAGYFFIRHLCLYGDLLGIKTSRMYGEQYALDELKPSNRGNLQMKGISLFEMLFGDMHFVSVTYKSFIGTFGYMQYQLPQFIYDFYSAWFNISFIGLIGFFVYKIFVKKWFKKGFNINTVVLYLCLALSMIVTIGLSIYNSYTVDFQPQGRYCYPAFPAIAFFSVKGIEFLLNSVFKKPKYRYAVVGGLFAVFAFITWQMYDTVYLPS